MDKLVVGQLVEVYEGKTWEFGVIANIFEDRYLVLCKDGSRMMVLTCETSEEFDMKYIDTDGKVEPLYQNGKPVMCAKSLFGRYKFKPVKG